MDFSSIDWASPTTIGIIVGIVGILAVAGYLFWARTQQKWPFSQE